MKRVFLVLMVAAASSLFCKESNGKIRVFSSEIDLSEHNMMAHVNGEWIPVEAIFHNSEGFYINYQVRNEGFRWLCDCGRYNFASDSVCMYCARDRYGDDEEDDEE